MHKVGFGQQMSELQFRALKAGKKQGFDAAYELYADPVYSLGLHLVRDPDLAKDMLQSTFESLLRKKHQLHSVDTLGAWLKRVLVNLCTAHFRTLKREIGSVSEDGQLCEPVEFSDVDLQKELCILANTQRSVVYLHLLRGLSFKEVGQTLGLTEVNCRQLYRRGLSTLRQSLFLEGEEQ